MENDLHKSMQALDLAGLETLETIRLLRLQPGQDDEPLQASITPSTLENIDKFDLLEYHSNGDDISATIEINQVSIDVPQPLFQALHQLRSSSGPRLIWVEFLCINQQSTSEKAHLQMTLLRKLHQAASTVFVWAGNHHEDKDSLNAWLGSGTKETTAFAFEVARDLVRDPDRLSPIVLDSVGDDGFSAWCYLARILYRQWFRRVPLAYKNYVSALETVTVLCQDATEDYHVLLAAADLMRRTQPAPRILTEPYLSKGRETEQYLSQLRNWVVERSDFGYDMAKFFLLIYIHREKAEGQKEEAEGHEEEAEENGEKVEEISGEDTEQTDQENGGQTHTDKVGTDQGQEETTHQTREEKGEQIQQETAEEENDYVSALYILSSIFHESLDGSDKYMPMCRAMHKIWKERGLSLEPTAMVVNVRSAPTLKMEEYLEFPPNPLDQRPYVYDTINQQTSGRRLVLFPHHGDPNSPIQCALKEVEDEHAPPFTYVLNSHLGNPFLRRPILVNGHSFSVPNAVEVFLHNFRDENNPKHLFLWLLCGEPKETEYESSDDVNYYLQRQRYYLSRAATRVDMHGYLNDMSEADMQTAAARYTKEDWARVTEHDPETLPVHRSLFLEMDDGRPTHPVRMPLDRAADEIRVLLLFPGDDESSPIKCSLRHVPLGLFTQYEAISYTWGHGELSKEITLNQTNFPITENLYSVLKHMRPERGYRVLWVDAICIDQDNIEEKSRQIPRMKQIYETARQVIVYLGEEADGSSDVISTLRQYHLAHEEQVDNKKHGLRHLHFSENKVPPDEVDFWRSVYKLLMRPHFTRVWCTQEMAVNESMLIRCGDQIMAWEVLHLFASTISFYWHYFEWLEFKDHPYDRRMQAFHEFGPDVRFLRPDIIRDIRHARADGRSMSLLSLMLANQNTSCADPRDKIYGYWSLASDAAKLIPTPDYSQPLAKVYTDYVFKWIDTYNRLDIICVAQVSRHVATPDDLYKVPSWVPDWSVPWLSNSFITLVPVSAGDTRRDNLENDPLYSAASTTKPIYANVSFKGADIDESRRGLCAIGMIVDKIARVGTEVKGIPARPIQGWFDMVREWTTEHGGDEQAVKEAEATLMRVLIANRDPAGTVGEFEGEEGAEKLRILFYRLSNSPSISEMPSTSIQIWENHINNVLRGRRVFITESGRIGLGHHHVEQGVHIAVLLGCSVPLTLLKRDNGFFLNMGDCYVDGLMEGQKIDEARENGELVGDTIEQETVMRLFNTFPKDVVDDETKLRSILLI